MYLSFQRISGFVFAPLTVAGICYGDMILNPIDRGRYSDTGYHETLNVAYGVGNGGTFIDNNFFVFGLVGLTEEVVAAEIQIFNPWSISPDPYETYTLYDVSTDIASLMNGSGGTSAFYDLQSGIIYGSINISADDNGTTIAIALNAQAIQDINNNAGGLFAVGGTINSTIDYINPKQEEIFGFTSTDNPAAGVSLILTTIPEPSVLGLLIASCGLLALRRIQIR